MFLILTCIRFLEKPLDLHIFVFFQFPQWFLTPFRQLCSLLAFRAKGMGRPISQFTWSVYPTAELRQKS